MLGNRYGFRPIPVSIPVPLFDTLRSLASDPDLLTKWYRRDDNAAPPVHLLQVRFFILESCQISLAPCSAVICNVLTYEKK